MDARDAEPVLMPWTTTSASSICWAQLSETITPNLDVDFTLQVSIQFPLCITDEAARALPVYTSTISVP